MSQDFISLDIPSIDYGSLGSKDLRFEFPFGAEGAGSFQDEIRTDFLVQNQFRNIIALIDKATGGDQGGGGLHLNIPGSDPRTWTINWQSPGDIHKPNTTTPYQWGSSSDEADGPNEHTATGETDTRIQQAVFMEALDRAAIGSQNPATLAYGEYSSSGIFDTRPVVVSEPSTNIINDQPSTFDGQFTLVATKDLSEAVTSTNTTG